MDRRITDYIQRQRRRYTRDAIREQLLRRGYAADQVEEGFRLVETGYAPPEAQLSVRFWVTFIGFLLVLYGGTVAAVAFGTPFGPIAAPILGVLLFLAAIVSIVLAAVNREAALGVTSGLVIVFVIPFVFLVVIAGSCLALLVSMTGGMTGPAPQTRGSIELSIDPPLAFQSAGGASCSPPEPGPSFSIFSDPLPQFDGTTVSVSMDSSGPAQASSTNVFIAVQRDDGTGPAAHYGTTPQSRIEIELEPDGRSGSVRFFDLGRMPGEPGALAAGPATISGEMSWQCD